MKTKQPFFKTFSRTIMLLAFSLLFSAKTFALLSVTGASPVRWGKPCEETDWLNFSTAGTLVGGVAGTTYKYTVSYSGSWVVDFYYLTFNGGSPVYPSTGTFVYSGTQMSIGMLASFDCTIGCGVQGSVTITFLNLSNVVQGSKTYTFGTPLNWLTPGPNASVCPNVPFTLNFNSQAGNPYCVLNVYCSNPSQWTINGSHVSSYQLINATSVTVMNTSGVGSTAVFSMYDGSLCNCCPTVCGAATCTLTTANLAITQHPQNKTICQNCPHTFQVGVNIPTGATYQWKKNGVNISGATLSTYTTALPGTYRASVTNCGTTLQSNNAVLTVDPQCICPGPPQGKLADEFNSAEPELRIFPNPSYDKFSVDLSVFDGEPVTIQVYDLMGRIAATYVNVPTRELFDFGSELTKGVYRVTVQGNERYSMQIVKQ